MTDLMLVKMCKYDEKCDWNFFREMKMRREEKSFCSCLLYTLKSFLSKKSLFLKHKLYFLVSNEKEGHVKIRGKL